MPGVKWAGAVIGFDEASAVEQFQKKFLRQGKGVKVRLSDGAERCCHAMAEHCRTPLCAVCIAKVNRLKTGDVISYCPIDKIERISGTLKTS